MPLLLELIVDHGCQVYMCDLSTRHLVISTHQFTYVKKTNKKQSFFNVNTNTMLYHVWIYELKTQWMCKWLDTIVDWLVETDQEQHVFLFYFFKEQYFDLRSMLNRLNSTVKDIAMWYPSQYYRFFGN